MQNTCSYLSVVALLCVCDGCSDSSDGDSRSDGTPSSAGPGRGFPQVAPWVSFYGTSAQMGDLKRVASTFRVINIDADPDGANFTSEQITTLKGGGQNRVISYLNLGACEQFRAYYQSAPSGLASCAQNTAAQRGPYKGYPDETWMDLGNADYQRLILEHVAPRLAATGVDGFFFDNLELVEHGSATQDGPCSADCAQGGLDLVRKLRARFPRLLFVMQNATSDVTRRGSTGGLSYPALLDGISHEEVFAPMADKKAETELLAWRSQGLLPGGRPFFVGTEDYVGDCNNMNDAKAAYMKSRADGFTPYATDASAGQRIVCFWPF